MTWEERIWYNHILYISAYKKTGNMYIVYTSGTIQRHVFGGWTSRCPPKRCFSPALNGASFVRCSQDHP